VTVGIFTPSVKQPPPHQVTPVHSTQPA
jgi:hypothetical protein